MTINKILITALAVCSFQLANAQGSKVNTAGMLMSDYDIEKNVKNLHKASEAIEAASKHESTANMGKTWYYMGKVNYLLSTDPTSKVDGNDYVSKAISSFEKALTIEDKKFRDDKKVLTYLKDMAAESFNASIEKQKAKDFKAAYDGYQRVVSIDELISKNGDKLQFDANLAVKNATFAAEDAGMMEEAISGYNAMIENDAKASYYFNLANLYKKQENDDMFIKTLDRGSKAFPDNANIIIAQLNHLRATGKKEEALAKIDEAISIQPDNEVLYFVKAKSYDDAGDKDKAIEIYEQAIKVNPKYTDAIYNIGAIHFLSGNSIIEKMNGLSTSASDTKIYNSLVEDRKAIYRKARTFFERVLEIKPEDASSIATLKKIDRVLER